MNRKLPDDEQLVEQFGAKFLASTPEADASYWSDIDQLIKTSEPDIKVETARSTEIGVCRTNAMDRLRIDRNHLLPLAASILLIAGSVGILRWLNSVETLRDHASSETALSESVDDTTNRSAPSHSSSGANPGLSLAVGEYCYLHESDLDRTGRLQILISNDYPITVNQEVDFGGDDTPANRSTFKGQGVSSGASDLSVSGRQYFPGAIEPNKVIRDSWKAIDSDIWQVTADSVTIGKQASTSAEGPDTYERTDCGPSFSDPPIASVGIDEKIEFAPGATNSRKSGIVSRGERDLYRVQVAEGQRMAVSITSSEANAVYELVSPAGLSLVIDFMGPDEFETTEGVYTIVVSGKPADANYDLSVSLTN